MALWGISTTQETWANSYAIPKFLNDQDKNFTPHNCFADDRGWIYRTYGTTVHSGLGTIYTDAVLVPVSPSVLASFLEPAPISMSNGT